MKEQEITYLSLENPTLALPDQTYGFANEPLLDKQIKFWVNRDIHKEQYFAFDCFTSSGTGDSVFREVLPQYMWDNKRWWVSKTAALISWLSAITYTASLNYSTDFFWWTTVIKVPPAAVLDIYCRVQNSTETVRINITWTYRFLCWNAADMDNTNNHITLINSSTSHLIVWLKYRTTASDTPRFWVLMRLIF